MQPKRYNAAIRIPLAIIAYFTAMFAYLGVMVALDSIDRVRTDYGFLASMNIGVSLVLCATVFGVYKLLDRGKPLQLGFGIRRKDFGFMLTAVAVSTAGALAFAGMASRNDALGATFHFEKLGDSAVVLLLVYGCIGWLIGVLQEEVFCRGYLMANLQRFGPGGAVLLSSIIFTLTHIPTKGFHAIELVIHLVGGLAYAYVYLKSGSLWVSAAVHACHNFLLDILFNNDYSVTLITFGRQLTDADKLLQQFVLVCGIILLTGLFYRNGSLFAPADNLRRLWQGGGRANLENHASINYKSA